MKDFHLAYHCVIKRKREWHLYTHSISLFRYHIRIPLYDLPRKDIIFHWIFFYRTIFSIEFGLLERWKKRCTDTSLICCNLIFACVWQCQILSDFSILPARILIPYVKCVYIF